MRSSNDEDKDLKRMNPTDKQEHIISKIQQSSNVKWR